MAIPIGARKERDASLPIGSASLSDDEFLDAVRECRLGIECFRHADHLRLGWILTRMLPVEDAVDEVRTLIQAFAEHHGKRNIYHETITRGWMHLLASHNESAFAEFLTRNRAALQTNLLHRYWKPESLQSQRAREAWLPPDVAALPERP